MKKIKLTQGRYALVDDNDFLSVNEWKWSVNKNGYACSRTKGELIEMHRLIMGFPKSQIDHRNGKKLDNQHKNLRLATQTQNSQNQIAHSNNKSGYKGVEFHKASQRWEARIRSNGTRIQLGLFKTALAAHRAYLKAARKYHGEFARLK